MTRDSKDVPKPGAWLEPLKNRTAAPSSQYATDPSKWREAYVRPAGRGGQAPNSPEAAAVPAGRKQSAASKYTPQMLALLGKRTDRRLARNFMIPEHQVTAKRKALGIRSFKESERRKWTPEELALLGKVSDCELGRRWGITCDRVLRMRVKLGIPPCRLIRWTPEEIAVLGAMTDAQAAQRLRISIHFVRAKRYQLGIKQYRPQSQRSKQRAKKVKALEAQTGGVASATPAPVVPAAGEAVTCAAAAAAPNPQP
ncbi:MAG: hypothetical protein ABSE73_11060 [Planctomycetota bacterium]